MQYLNDTVIHVNENSSSLNICLEMNGAASKEILLTATTTDGTATGMCPAMHVSVVWNSLGISAIL